MNKQIESRKYKIDNNSNRLVSSNKICTPSLHTRVGIISIRISDLHNTDIKLHINSEKQEIFSRINRFLVNQFSVFKTRYHFNRL